MIPGYTDFKNLINKKQIKMKNEKFNQTIQKFDIFQIPSVDITNQQIHDSISKSKVIIIDKYTNNGVEFVICCIKSLIMIINPSEEAIIKDIISANNIYRVPKSSDIPKYPDNLKKEFLEISQFYKELYNFMKAFKINIKKEDIIKFWSIIGPSIAAYLIKKSYLETYKDRINEFFKNFHLNNQIRNFKQNEFIELKEIGKSTSSLVSLCYHVENEKLYAIKTFFYENKLKEREINNYMKIKHLFIPNY